MSVEATAEALAPETAAPIPTQELPLDDQMAAIWDKNQKEEPENPTPEQPEAKVEAENQPSEEPAPVEEVQKPEIPSDIPTQLRGYWDSLPEDARQGVQDFARETNRKLSEQGRLMHGINPIRDSLVEATEKFPHLAEMTPQNVAKEVFQLAEISAEFQQKPVETMLSLAKKHGIEEHLRQALTGQQSQAPLQAAETIRQQQQTIEQLRKQISQVADPEFIRSQVTAVTTEQQTMGAVTDFAKSAEHWDQVEEILPQFIPAAQAIDPNASPQDVLKVAYDLAVSRVVPEDKKAPAEATDQVANITDPEKAKAVLKAKSVNVTSQPSKPRQMTQAERDAAIWDKHNT